MKSKGRHPEKALSAVQVRALKQPGRYSDGNGLYLVIDLSGAKRWVLRTVVQGRRSDMGLGGVSLVSLAEAREKALIYRKLAREGGNPIAERRKVQLVVPTFAEAAERVHAENESTWKNPKHAAQWINTLRQHVFPTLGQHRVDRIATPDVLRVLSPIWLTKAETARRVRQRMGTVFDWAKAAGFHNGDNPIDGVTKGLPKQSGRGNHHAALPYSEVPAFVAGLKAIEANELTKLAFEFLILTTSRTNEVLGAKWEEFDESERLWTVPAERMKAARLHRVPLADRILDILKQAKSLDGRSAYVFPGRKATSPMSNMAFLMLLRRQGSSVTAHGFRSSFRDWASESTNFPREVAEMALAHAVEDKVEAAYRRGDLLEKRRELMQIWSDYVTDTSRKPG